LVFWLVCRVLVVWCWAIWGVGVLLVCCVCVGTEHELPAASTPSHPTHCSASPAQNDVCVCVAMLICVRRFYEHCVLVLVCPSLTFVFPHLHLDRHAHPNTPYRYHDLREPHSCSAANGCEENIVVDQRCSTTKLSKCGWGCGGCEREREGQSECVRVFAVRPCIFGLCVCVCGVCVCTFSVFAPVCVTHTSNTLKQITNAPHANTYAHTSAKECALTRSM